MADICLHVGLGIIITEICALDPTRHREHGGHRETAACMRRIRPEFSCTVSGSFNGVHPVFRPRRFHLPRFSPPIGTALQNDVILCVIVAGRGVAPENARSVPLLVVRSEGIRYPYIVSLLAWPFNGNARGDGELFKNDDVIPQERRSPEATRNVIEKTRRFMMWVFAVLGALRCSQGARGEGASSSQLGERC